MSRRTDIETLGGFRLCRLENVCLRLPNAVYGSLGVASCPTASGRPSRESGRSAGYCTLTAMRHHARRSGRLCLRLKADVQVGLCGRQQSAPMSVVDASFACAQKRSFTLMAAVVEERAFGDLQIEPRRREAGRSDGRQDRFGKLCIFELQGRDIDRDRTAFRSRMLHRASPFAAPIRRSPASGLLPRPTL